MINLLQNQTVQWEDDGAVQFWRIKFHLRNISCCQTIVGRFAWLQEEDQKEQFFRCAFDLYSIIDNGLILGGQDSSRRQTLSFLLFDPRDKEHQDPEHIDFSVPRRARYLHSAWKKHQDAVFWVDIDLAIKEGLIFYQTRSNVIILQGTLPAYCIPKVVRLKT